MLHAAPADGCEKPVWHVHAPVPVMPWSQMPPTPQLHDRQLGPYLLAGHCPHEVPFGKVPVGQLDTHALPIGSSSSGAVQLTQVVAVVTHVAQLALQPVHTLLALT